VPLGLATLLGGWYASDSLRHRRESGHGYDLGGGADLDVGAPEIMRAAEVLTGAPVSTGDEVELLVNGDEIFPAFLETIAAAEHTLNLVTYVYWRGEIAHEMARALEDKARSGVEVNVLLDAVGTLKMERDVIDGMQRGGVRVARFRPLKPYAIRRANNRTHRKVLVADGRVGMIGGVGIAEEWTGDAQDPEHWRDTHVRIRGPIVRWIRPAHPSPSPRTGSRRRARSSAARITCRSSSRSTAVGRCRSCGRPRASATPRPRRCTSWRSRRPGARSS
jgi:cardiolipin synthase